MELYSSAFTLSDMEIFIFPELLYSLVLANIMSPRIWKWRKDPWFQNIDKLNFNKRVNRLKQYIMDNYHFNLDLETWGLTTREKELQRFSGYIDPEIISESNALFGYQGDKYYFSIDIRKHFGLDKYENNIIPYWKTETIEAMDAFRYKEGFVTGAGECVSLSSLYAAALYIVLGIPLKDIFLIATPLHSQNFVMEGKGVITNNRRILTKRMWYNGTILSEKARRALEKEHITYISHITGYIHKVYNNATIDSSDYRRFASSLKDFLKTGIDGKIFVNFLRVYSRYRKYFQFSFNQDGKQLYIASEKLYEYEHSSRFRIDDNTRKKLFQDIPMDDFDLSPHEGRYILNTLEDEMNRSPFLCTDEESLMTWRKKLEKIPEHEELLTDLASFSCIIPGFPDSEKTEFNDRGGAELCIEPGMEREEIIEYLTSMRESSSVADLSFFSGRYCGRREWPTFLKAAIERNPVIIEFFKDKSIKETYFLLKDLEDQSIYQKGQYAQPDEVINFRRGNGIERSITLASLILSRERDAKIRIVSTEEKTMIFHGESSFVFPGIKGFSGEFFISINDYEYRDI
jgi:hypothetical protein